MCKIIDKTCLSPTPTLEQHLMWDDIAILARYMLMLSFNNSLDVAAHLPYLFHVVTLLVATGPLSLRASTHGLVINIIHSLCTCSQLNFSGEDTPSHLYIYVHTVLRSVCTLHHFKQILFPKKCIFTTVPLKSPLPRGPIFATVSPPPSYHNSPCVLCRGD